MRRVVVSATTALCVALCIGVPARAASQELAPPGAAITGYAAPVVIANRADGLQFVNADPLSQHNVQSVEYGPDTNPWCSDSPPGQCPLFATPLTAAGKSVTGDLRGTAVGGSYAFVCVLHKVSMHGTLIVLS